jgi:predicted dehydrogenase
VGFLGAGNYARSHLLPSVRANRSYHLVGVATAHPYTAEHTAQRFGFSFASTDPHDVLEDPTIDIVFIATRHDTHAQLAAAALASCKAVFVEKPLALDEDSLHHVLQVQSESSGVLCVGFNRRLSPLLQRLRTALPAGTPRQVLIRVNAGALPSDHWLLDPAIGGGRLIGEGCHFFDLACYLVDADPRRVQAAGSSDDFTASVEFDDGSMATLVYTAAGSSSLSKERIEVFSGGAAFVLEDFRTLEFYRAGRRRRVRLRQPDKGNRALVNAFLQASSSGKSPPITLPEIETAHRLTFAAAEQVRGA